MSTVANEPSGTTGTDFRTVTMKVAVLRIPTHPPKMVGQAMTQDTNACVTYSEQVNSAPICIDLTLNKFFGKLTEDCPKGGFKHLHMRPNEFTDGIRRHRVHQHFDRSYLWQRDGYTVIVSFSAGSD